MWDGSCVLVEDKRKLEQKIKKWNPLLQAIHRDLKVAA
jgi:hypothetical protein